MFSGTAPSNGPVFGHASEHPPVPRPSRPTTTYGIFGAKYLESGSDTDGRLGPSPFVSFTDQKPASSRPSRVVSGSVFGTEPASFARFSSPQQPKRRPFSPDQPTDFDRGTPRKATSGLSRDSFGWQDDRKPTTTVQAKVSSNTAGGLFGKASTVEPLPSPITDVRDIKFQKRRSAASSNMFGHPSPAKKLTFKPLFDPTPTPSPTILEAPAPPVQLSQEPASGLFGCPSVPTNLFSPPKFTSGLFGSEGAQATSSRPSAGTTGFTFTGKAPQESTPKAIRQSGTSSIASKQSLSDLGISALRISGSTSSSDVNRVLFSPPSKASEPPRLADSPFKPGFGRTSTTAEDKSSPEKAASSARLSHRTEEETSNGPMTSSLFSGQDAHTTPRSSLHAKQNRGSRSQKPTVATSDKMDSMASVSVRLEAPEPTEVGVSKDGIPHSEDIDSASDTPTSSPPKYLLVPPKTPDIASSALLFRDQSPRSPTKTDASQISQSGSRPADPPHLTQFLRFDEKREDMGTVRGTSKAMRPSAYDGVQLLLSGPSTGVHAEWREPLMKTLRKLDATRGQLTSSGTIAGQAEDTSHNGLLDNICQLSKVDLAVFFFAKNVDCDGMLVELPLVICSKSGCFVVCEEGYKNRRLVEALCAAHDVEVHDGIVGFELWVQGSVEATRRQ